MHYGQFNIAFEILLKVETELPRAKDPEGRHWSEHEALKRSRNEIMKRIKTCDKKCEKSE